MSTRRGNGCPVGCKPAALRRTGSSILSACTCYLVMVACVVALAIAGCATALPTVRTGIEAGTAAIKVACPKRTTPCEDALIALNSTIVFYNSAILAEAVKEDSSALANSALSSLKAVWTSLQTIGAQNELASPAGPPQ